MDWCDDVMMFSCTYGLEDWRTYGLEDWQTNGPTDSFVDASKRHEAIVPKQYKFHLTHIPILND